MAAARVWQRRMVATGVVAAAALTPLLPMTLASAASLCAPPADTVPPQITSVTFSTQSVDVSTGSRTVTISAHATDTSGNGAASGVKRIDVDLSGTREGASAQLALASGTADDGVWQGTVTIPKDAKSGTWLLREVFAVDAAHNDQSYSQFGKHPQLPSDIRLQSGWDQSISVTGSTTPPPTTVKPGTITAFGFTPQAVDTTNAAKTVHVTATFSRPYPKRVNLFFSRSSGHGRPVEGGPVFKHTTGGHWAGQFKVHRWSGDSKDRPQIFAEYGQSVKPRFRNFSPDALSAKHFPTVLTITSGVDATKPALNTLTFSPSSVDTTSGAQTVTVTATASDALSGVRRVQANLYIRRGDVDASPVGGFYPYPGLGFQQSGNVSVILKPNGNTWTGTATFRRCVPSGDWKATVSVSDRANNFANYSSKKLTAAGLPGTLPVTSTPGDVEAPDVRGATASGADHTITLDFSEGVKNVNTSTLSLYAQKPASSRFAHAATVTAITCSNGTTDVDCSGGGGLVTSAILNVPAVVLGAQFEVYANLNALTTQLTDGTGNPLAWGDQDANVTGS